MSRQTTHISLGDTETGARVVRNQGTDENQGQGGKVVEFIREISQSECAGRSDIGAETIWLRVYALGGVRSRLD